MSSNSRKQIPFAEINPFPTIFTIAPANKDHEVGIRCGISVFVPLLTLLLIDRIDLAIFASFSAFTAIYGRNLDHGPRFKTQLRAGLLMATVVILASAAGRLGITERQNPWGLVAATTLIAGVLTVIVAYWRLRPAGSLFHIFAFAAVASVPYQPPWPDVLITIFATVAWALLVGISSRIWSKKRRSEPMLPPKDEPFYKDDHLRIWREGLGFVIAAGTAGSLATALGPLLGMQHNYWAMIAAVVPLVGHSTQYRVSRGLQRIIGTFIGLGLMALIVMLRPDAWLVVLIIGVLQFAVELYSTRQYVLTQILVTPMALLATVLGSMGADVAVNANQLLYDRALETVIGSVVGVIIVLIPWFWQNTRLRAHPEKESS